MTTYYVDPAASPGGDGLTPATAFDAWGDVTWLSGDTYVQSSGTTTTADVVQASNVTLQLTGATFDVAAGNAWQITTKTDVHFSGGTIRNTTGQAVLFNSEATDCSVTGMALEDKGLVFNATAGDMTNCTVNNCSIDGTTISVGTQQLVAVQTGGGAVANAGNKFVNLTVKDSNGIGDLKLNGFVFDIIAADDWIDHYNNDRKPTGTQILNNYIEQTVGFSVYVNIATDGGIRWNRAHGCGNNTTHNTFQMGGVERFDITDNVITDTNVNTTADGYCIIMDRVPPSGSSEKACINTKIHRNWLSIITTSSNDNAPAIYMYRAKDCEAVANVVNGTKGGTAIGGETVVEDYNDGNTFRQNTIYNCIKGHRVAEATVQAHHVTNTILADCTTGIIKDAIHSGGAWPTVENCGFSGNGTDVNDTDAAGTTGSNPVVADAQFISKTTGDFRLEASSPCVGTGTHWWRTGAPTELVTNGTFDSDVTGWGETLGVTLAWSAGRMELTSTDTTVLSSSDAITMVVGHRYRLSADIYFGDITSCRVITDYATTNTLTESGSVSVDMVATDASTTVTIVVVASGAGETVEVDNISLMDITDQPLDQSGLRFPLRAGQPDIGAHAVRPGEDGATRKAYTLPVSYLEAGSDLAKSKAA